MRATVLPLRTRLPAIDPGEAEARNRLLAALDGLAAGAGRLSARIAEPGACGVALAFAAGGAAVHLVAERVERQPARPLALASPSLPETLVELSRLEPLIAAVERALGRSLDPVAVKAEPEAGVRLSLQLRKAGELVHAVRLTVPFELAEAAPARRDRPLGLAALAPVACRLALEGPRAPRGELAQLEAGDVVIIPPTAGSAGGVAAGLGVQAVLSAGNGRWRGRFKLDRGEFHVQREESAVLDDPPSPLGASAIPSESLDPPAPAAPAATAAVADLPVRLQLVFPTLSLSVGALAGLAPGSVVPLPVEGEDLPVSLQVEGVELASGRLVALGTGYGVLIDEVCGRS